MDELIFLEFGVIEEIHEASLEAYGGSPGVRDRNLIESALAAGENTFHYGNGDLFDIAAAYAFHLAQAQAFLDGNKRTGAGAAILFLRSNGVNRVPDDLLLHEALIAIAEKRLDKPGLAQIFRATVGSSS